MSSNLADRFGRVLIAGVSWIVMLYLALPLFVVIAISFTTTEYLKFPPEGLTLRWYWKVVSDPTFVERLIRSFRLDAERLVQTITDGLAARRYEQVKDAAHALRGGAGGVGATQLVQIAIRLENSNHDTLRIKASGLTEELTRAANLTLALLDRHIEERRSRSRK